MNAFLSAHKSGNEQFFMGLHIFAFKLAYMRARISCPINLQTRTVASA